VVGRHAGAVAAAMGARTLVFGRHPEQEAQLKAAISPDIHLVLSTPENIAQEITDADLVVGGVLLRGARAPHVVTQAMVESMQPGSVIVDVSIDQGGCVATSRPTSHSDPVFIEHGVIHYCVTNMPGAYPRTSTLALTAATLPFARRLAAEGLPALRQDSAFARGVNVHGGRITCEAVATDLDRPGDYRPFR
jgi:alanine dehydrogenase